MCFLKPTNRGVKIQTRRRWLSPGPALQPQASRRQRAAQAPAARLPAAQGNAAAGAACLTSSSPSSPSSN